MLDHADRDAVLLDHGAQPGFAHQIVAGRNFRAALVGAAKDHALPGRRRRQGHGHRHAGMQGGAGNRDLAGQASCGTT